jgi:predicted amidohydrolase YtcJ
MIKAGITPDTKEPDGGKIIKAKDGEPTGVFIDNAMDLIYRVKEDLSPEQKEEAIISGVNKLVELGITEIHDMGVNADLINVYKKLVEENKMLIRICVYISDVDNTWNEYKQKPKDLFGNDFLTVCGVKLFVDGALGSRGAALIEPYSDDKTNRGLTILSESEIQSITEDALKHNMQVAVHAIGDRGNSIVLTAFEKVLKNRKEDGKLIKDSRLRVEHAQILHPDDIIKFSEYEIIPSMQPVHATSDMYWVEARLGNKRTKNSYLWKTLIDKGSKIPSGSDFPVESPNIIENYYAAVTRKDKNGAPNSWSEHKHLFSCDKTDIDTTNYSNGWYAKEKMSRLEALKSFTEWAAYSVFQEKVKGTIEVGKYADFVVLSGDILELKEEDILSIRVLKTVVNGKLVFENK